MLYVMIYVLYLWTKYVIRFDIRFNSGYIIHITAVHTMGSHTVRTLKVLDPCELVWRWLQCCRNM